MWEKRDFYGILRGAGERRSTDPAAESYLRTRHAGQPATSQRSSLSRDRPLRGGRARRRRAAHAALGNLRQSRRASRSCSCTAARAAVACRTIAATSIPRSGASCSSTSAAAGRSTPMRRDHRQHDAASRRRPRAAARSISASTDGCSSADRGARRSRSRMPKRIPQRCLGLVLRGIFLAGRPSSTGSCTACATSFRKPGARSANSCRPPSAATSSAATTAASCIPMPPCTCRPRTRGTATKARAPSSCRRPIRLPKFDSDASSLAIARIEAHYFVHQAFLGPDELLANLGRIRHLPCTIVQGRYDIICPPVTADALARAWPEAEYIIVPGRRPFGARARHHARARRGGQAHAAEGRTLTD